MKLTPTGAFTAGAALLVVASLGVGLYLVGPPGDVRARRLDDERLAELQGLASAVASYQDQEKTLPATLEAAVEQNAGAWGDARDPETGAAYEYRATGPASYELCARFALASDRGGPVRWRHPAGRQCYGFEIKPARAPAGEVIFRPTPTPVPRALSQ